MTRVSISTALASLLMFYGMSDAQASSINQKASSSDREVQIKRVENRGSLGRYISVSPAIDVGGSLMSHGWFAFRDRYYQDQGIKNKLLLSQEQLGDRGVATDAMLYVTAEGRNDTYGIYYGCSMELDVPYSQQADYTSYRQIRNRGAKVYLNTSYGDFAFGYQPGVDSFMRIDAFSIGAGDNSNTWMRYVNLKGVRDPLSGVNKGNVPLLPALRAHYLENVYYLSTGLYSESITEGANRFSGNTVQPAATDRTFGIANALPLRFSYLSPSFGGLKLGVSYAPFGFDEDQMIAANSAISTDQVVHIDGRTALRSLGGVWSREILTLPIVSKHDRTRFIFPMYEHFINIGMTYSSYFNGLDFKISMVSEYAKPKSRILDNRRGVDFPRMDSIKNVALGGMLKYKGVKFAVSYGYLGKIDKVSNMYYFENGSYSLNDADRVVINTEGTSFWTVGGGYDFGALYVSAAYRGSSYSGNRLDEMTFGAEYDISGDASRVKSKLFANYHNYAAVSSEVVKPSETDGSNRGQVILAGMKVKF